MSAEIIEFKRTKKKLRILTEKLTAKEVKAEIVKALVKIIGIVYKNLNFEIESIKVTWRTDPVTGDRIYDTNTEGTWRNDKAPQ